MPVPRWRAAAALTVTVWAAPLAWSGSACSSTSAERVAASSTSIVGGSLDRTHGAVISLLKQVQGGFYPSCSGTLLTQNLVLTAHHCVAGLTSQDGTSVDCGKTHFRAPEAAATMLVSIEANVGEDGLDPYRVAEVWVPETESVVCGKDIALLLLTGAGIPANVAQPITPGLAAEVKPDAIFAAIGYGLQDPNDEQGATAGHRMGVADAQVFCAGKACGTPLVSASEWIADSPVCPGDSGGPALDEDGRVVGVTSRGDPECTIGIYSSVYAWRDFIIKGVFEAAAAGRYTPPAWAGDPPPGFDPSSNGSGGSSSSIAGAGSGGSLSLAGGPAAAGTNTGGGAPMSPVVDPLGLSCTGYCPGAYKCWAETGLPPGICVPACSESALACPEDFTCSTELQACVKTSALKGSEANDASSCRASPTRHRDARDSSWLMALGLLGGVLARRVRRRRTV